MGAFAAPRIFAVGVPVPAAPTLVTPSDAAVINTTNRPTFVWNTSPSAAWYNLEISSGVAVVFSQWYQAGVGGCTVATCTLQIPNPLAYGGYTWRVRAWSQGGMGTFSASRSFFSLSLNPQPLMIGADESRVQRSGVWNLTSSERAAGQAYLSSSGSLTDTLTFAFSGTAAEVVYIAGPGYGSFAVEVDGVVLRAVNANAAQESVGNLIGVSGLEAGDHLLRILPLGGAPIAIDGVIVDGQALIASQPQPTPSPTIDLPPLVVTAEPTAAPTSEPTVEPTAELTLEPTVEPTVEPTLEPTVESTAEPTLEMTEVPTPAP
ncbi:MAG: hypothetical protein U0694_24830 [Anaerolineae bacterium]